MQEFVRLFAQIALLRRGPQDLPASALLLVAASPGRRWAAIVGLCCSGVLAAVGALDGVAGSVVDLAGVGAVDDHAGDAVSDGTFGEVFATVLHF